jgi:hypothetical protein
MRICSELVSEKFRAKLDAFSLVIRTYTCETLACVETIQHLDIFYYLQQLRSCFFTLAIVFGEARTLPIVRQHRPPGWPFQLYLDPTCYTPPGSQEHLPETTYGQTIRFKAVLMVFDVNISIPDRLSLQNQNRPISYGP